MAIIHSDDITLVVYYINLLYYIILYYIIGALA